MTAALCHSIWCAALIVQPFNLVLDRSQRGFCFFDQQVFPRRQSNLQLIAAEILAIKFPANALMCWSPVVVAGKVTEPVAEAGVSAQSAATSQVRPVSRMSPTEQADDQRRSPRKSVRQASERSAKVSVSGPALQFRTKLIDISPHGCNIQVAGQSLGIGQFVTLGLNGVHSISGLIRWLRGGQAGIEFLRSLPNDLVEQFAASDGD